MSSLEFVAVLIRHEIKIQENESWPFEASIAVWNKLFHLRSADCLKVFRLNDSQPFEHVQTVRLSSIYRLQTVLVVTVVISDSEALSKCLRDCTFVIINTRVN